MTTWGLTDAGVNVPRSADFLTLIRDEYERQTQLEIDWDYDVFLGQITANMAIQLGLLANVVQAVADSQDPTNATGAQLDMVCLLVGLLRKVATFSTAVLVLSGTDGTAVTTGRLVEGGGERNNARWRIAEDAVLSTTVLGVGTVTFHNNGAQPHTITRNTGSWIADGVAPGTPLTIAGSTSNNKIVKVTRVVSAASIEIQQSLVAEGPVLGPSITGAFATVNARAVLRGAVRAAQGTITRIVTPVSGWSGVSNPSMAATGSDTEADEDLRIRREQSLQVTGSASVNAIRSKLLALAELSAAVVIENDTMLTTVVAGKTLPPKSLACVVWPNTLTNDEKKVVAEVIYRRAPAGIEIVGTDVVTIVTGRDGYAKTVSFDYATSLTVNVATLVTLEVGYTLANVQGAVADAIVAYFASLLVGDPVRELDIKQRLAQIDGVAGATLTFNGGAADIVPLITQIPILGTNTVV